MESSFTYKGENIVISGKKDDHIMGRLEKKHTFYESDMLEAIARTKRGGLYVDVGANIGNHTIFLAKFTGARAVHSFEPNKQAFNYLVENLEKNDIVHRVNPYNMALGADEGTVSSIVVDENNLGASKVTTDKNGGIPMVTLDSVFEKQKVGVIKIDVEGFEPQVLMGASRTLERYLPDLFIEAADDSAKSTIDELLTKFGYKDVACYNATPTYHYRATRSLLRRLTDR
jgi:FkbM family methyltransferase